MQNKYKTFQALGVLLWYPNEEWLPYIKELFKVIEAEKLIEGDQLEGLKALSEYLANPQDLLKLQEDYVETFDRIRSLSLHLFEHVHGESRDRGQAMVDLADLYGDHGYELDENELPDYLPVFLEYLSTISKEEALDMLKDPAHIIVALEKRLSGRESPYAAVFGALVKLCGRVPEAPETIAPHTFEQLDKSWEEVPVEFLGAPSPQKSSGCTGCSCGK